MKGFPLVNPRGLHPTQEVQPYRFVGKLLLSQIELLKYYTIPYKWVQYEFNCY